VLLLLPQLLWLLQLQPHTTKAVTPASSRPQAGSACKLLLPPMLLLLLLLHGAAAAAAAGYMWAISANQCK
jgi:hypothetical protein